MKTYTRFLQYCITFSLLLISCALPSYADTNNLTPSDVTMDGYDLVSEENIYFGEEPFVLEQWHQRTQNPSIRNFSLENYNTYTDSTIYAVRSAVPGSTGNTASEEKSYLSYAVRIKTVVTYNEYSDSENPYITYYKITNYSFTVLDLESPCQMISTTLSIQNEGSKGSGYLISDQKANANIGTSLSGSVSGNASWYPTYSIEDLFVKAYFQSAIKRGQTTYNISDSTDF